MLSFFYFSVPASAQAYWQQKTDYTIAVSLNDKEKTLDAFEKIIYTNNAPDTLSYIWFHLWPNAYKTDRTAFSEQLLQNGHTAFYFADKEQRGYINRLDFKVNGTAARLEDHPQYIDVVKLLLPRPLPPGQKVMISTPFHVKLPFNFSRGGYDGETFQITQWYPKPAVYDRAGWHPMPYLDQGEFYSEFGSFEVQLTLPRNYVVAATGVLEDKEEMVWLKSKAFSSYGGAKPAGKLKTKQSPKAAGADKSGAARKKEERKIASVRPSKITDHQKEEILPDVTATKTLIFKQDSIHDFALFAAKDFMVDTDTCRLPSGKIITVSAYFTPAYEAQWSAAVTYAKDGLRFYSSQLGDYPYSTATVVQGPQSFGGGMEYPTITVISPSASARALDQTIAHELGHNWFYGALASNERDHPWMDEGMNSFYEAKYMRQKYGPQSQEEELLLQTKARNKTDQPIAMPSAAFSETNYGLVAYYKAARWMQLLEQKLGTGAFTAAMRQYYSRWAFRHPQPEDFKAVFSPALGPDSTAIFSLLDQKGLLPNQQLSGFRTITPFQKSSVTNYLEKPVKNSLLVSPVFGANSYDKLMIGAAVSNFGLTPSALRFFAVPLYATGSGRFTGIGKLSYSFYSTGSVRKTEVFVNGASFTMNEFRDSAGRKYSMRFSKLVPGIRLTFKEKSALSTVNKWMQWKTFFITEQSLKVTGDSVFGPSGTFVLYRYATPSASRYLNQLQFAYSNYRALYPFNGLLQVEQSPNFLRPALTADYFFNYAKGGGLSLRFFAGKFIYLNHKQTFNDRYLLNMTGANGEEDYTYSDYFIGRNKYEGWPSQQIMIRDGGFKVRTDLLYSKVGKTDNWLTALNFNSSLPAKYNPLSVLPVKIPVHLFFDIGTNAEAWSRTANSDRFLYDAGLHLPLLDGTVNIYIPVFYSRVYRDYFKSAIPEKRFFRTISFSVNLNHTALKKLNREIEL